MVTDLKTENCIERHLVIDTESQNAKIIFEQGFENLKCFQKWKKLIKQDPNPIKQV